MRKRTVRAREAPTPIGMGGACVRRCARSARRRSRSQETKSPGPALGALLPCSTAPDTSRRSWAGLAGGQLGVREEGGRASRVEEDHRAPLVDLALADEVDQARHRLARVDG